MASDTGERNAGDESRVGLCLTCRHSARIVSASGSTFYLCERSRSDPAFPRYPRLPVRECAGWERATDREQDV